MTLLTTAFRYRVALARGAITVLVIGLVALLPLASSRPAQLATGPVSIGVASVAGVPVEFQDGIHNAIYAALEQEGFRDLAKAERRYSLDFFVSFQLEPGSDVLVKVTYEVRGSDGDRIGAVEQKNIVSTEIPAEALWKNIETLAVPVGIGALNRLVMK